MPRAIDPSTLITGGGLVDPLSVTPVVSTGSAGLDIHIDDPIAAHPASAVSLEDPYARYVMGANVQGALNELSSLVPPAMGGIGSNGVAWLGSVNTGSPDWGILKLRDGSIPATGNPAADTKSVYPYYYRSPVCPTGVGVTGNGLDVDTDPVFNYFDAGGFPAYTGCGEGEAHAGFATLVMGANPATGVPSWRILPDITDPAVVVSGVVHPADRGVLALVKWAAGNLTAPPVALTTTGTVLQRCIAAILLGKGLRDGLADGQPGGIFSEGSTGVRAEGSISFVANPAAPYTVTVNAAAIGGPTIVFTATAGAPTTTREFQVAGGGPATAVNFMKAFLLAYFPKYMTNQADGLGVVTTIMATPGTAGNGVTPCWNEKKLM